MRVDWSVFAIILVAFLPLFLAIVSLDAWASWSDYKLRQRIWRDRRGFIEAQTRVIDEAAAMAVRHVVIPAARSPTSRDAAPLQVQSRTVTKRSYP